MEVFNMSKFSGKCDFYDEIEIFGLENILKSKVYIGDSKEPLSLTCLEDCIPYYPHIVYMSAKTNGVGTIRLTEKSYIDMREDEFGPSPYLEYYRKELEREKEKYGIK